MTVRFAACITIGACLFLSVPGAGEEYHVARQAGQASDANDGLAPVYLGGNHGPWESLHHASQVATAGDTVWIHAGDYRGEVTGWGGDGVIHVDNSGSPGAPIRFRAAPGPPPLVQRMLIHDREWIEIEGLAFESTEYDLPATWLDMPMITVDDPTVVIDPREDWSTRAARVRQKYATYTAMQDFFLTQYTVGVDVKNSHHVTLQGNSFRLYTFGVQIRGVSSNLLIQDNNFDHNHDGIFSWLPEPSISDSIIRRNVIRHSFNSGIQIRQQATSVVIASNDIRWSGTSHISLLADSVDCSIRGNRAVFGGYYSETMEFPGSSAINVHTSGPGNIVEGNLAAYQNDPTLVDGNGYIADLMRPDGTVLFVNNVAYRNVGSGIRTVETPGCVIVHNTLVENGYGAETAYGGAGVYLARSHDTQTTIANNIFKGHTSASIKSWYTADQQAEINFNLFDESPGIPLLWDGGEGDRAYFDLQSLHASTAWETEGRVASAQLADHAALDFHLTSASAAIDGGRAAPEATSDYSGIPRPRGDAPDMGAFEYCPDGCQLIFQDGFEGGDIDAWR